MTGSERTGTLPGLISGAFLFAGGMLVFIFARKLAAFNDKVVRSFPESIRNFYQNTASMGHPYDSDFWIKYNQIGGIIVAAVGALAMALAVTHH